MDNNELYHYGILGMKWGVRRSRGSGGGSSKRKASDDYKTAKRIKKKPVKAMSNDELRKLNERKQLEQNYSRLNPSIVKRGMKHVATAAGAMSTALTLYNNSDKLINLGKKAADAMLKK